MKVNETLYQTVLITLCSVTYHVRVGRGTPRTRQRISSASPSYTTTFLKSERILGGSPLTLTATCEAMVSNGVATSHV